MATPPPIEVVASKHLPLGMPPVHFLRTYWQRRPLLVRQALPGYRAPLGGDDLAGLACMDGALARIVTWQPPRSGRRDTTPARNDGAWNVLTGPFDDATFARLPAERWTLLVQDVDKWDPQVARLLEYFRFLPSWRLDDVMISYAEDGGGVGAHVDQYDVFLVQGAGQRRWCIDAGPNPNLAFRPGLDLKLLERFTPTHDWVLDPGDMLYLPPGVPHDGTAVGDACMTMSVGMRAPSAAELTLDLAEHLADRLPENRRYGDAGLAPTTHAGEIDTAALARVRATLGPMAVALDDAQLGEWFGAFITRYRSAGGGTARKRPMRQAQLERELGAGKVLVRDAWTRMAWVRHGHRATLFADGTPHSCTVTLAQKLCGDAAVRFPRSPGLQAGTLLLDLLNHGQLHLVRP